MSTPYDPAADDRLEKEARPVTCGNCAWSGFEDEIKIHLADIADLQQRIDPGGEVPIGECPDCGALAYLDKDTVKTYPHLHKSKLLIEVHRGSVSAVYSDCNSVEVFAVDLDGAQVGEGAYCFKHEIEPLAEAPDLVRDALTDGMGKGPQ